MNISDLRKIIKANKYYYLGENYGVDIDYYIRGQLKLIHLSSEELISELIAIGSEDEGFAIPLVDYTLSQWDILNIAIRHEYALHIEKEIEESDIGKAIRKFTL